MPDLLHIAPPAYWATVAALVGLALGSFATVVAWRWPREESLVHPRSHCTTCDRTLRAHELVPVVSWLVQRGRCRGCGTGIPARYPLMEAASAALAAGAVLTFGPTAEGLAAALLGVALVPVVAVDIEHRLIPDVVVLPATALALAAAIAAEPGAWWKPVAAATGAAGFLFLLWLVYPGGMGLGDVKLALLLGAVLGVAVIPALALAFLAGSLLGVALLMRHGRAARRMAIPFGPFLAAGALVALWWGHPLVGWYAERLG
ncbi:MAG TPA: prepilin peptidase [Miltoncostaeaceae bacterium]|jgi:leader peptidase (prepilin peptidase) / N-methyltransferase|nr:prepilin peptidase [Miltoncostaeaceae bacterium]